MFRLFIYLYFCQNNKALTHEFFYQKHVVIYSCCKNHPFLKHSSVLIIACLGKFPQQFIKPANVSFDRLVC